MSPGGLCAGVRTIDSEARQSSLIVKRESVRRLPRTLRPVTTLPPLSPSPVEIAFCVLALVNIALLVIVAVLMIAGRPPVRLRLSELVVLLVVPVLGPALVLRRHAHERRNPSL